MQYVSVVKYGLAVPQLLIFYLFLVERKIIIYSLSYPCHLEKKLDTSYKIFWIGEVLVR
jgi:hypothetical protein